MRNPFSALPQMSLHFETFNQYYLDVLHGLLKFMLFRAWRCLIVWEVCIPYSDRAISW